MNVSLQFTTFNCGLTPIDVDAFAASLFVRGKGKSTDDLPDLLFLALQEVAPLPYAFLGGRLLAPYFARFVDAVRVAAKAAGGSAYDHVLTHNAGMTAAMLFVKTGRPLVEWVQTGEVGVGTADMGNKGAAAIRVGCSTGSEVVPLTLVAAHLAPHEVNWTRRNDDWAAIARQLAFTAAGDSTASLSVGGSSTAAAASEQEPLLGRDAAELPTAKGTSGLFVPGSPVFFGGDLNYRTADDGPGPEDVDSFPQPVASADPRHWSHVLDRDQLSRERAAGRTLHGLAEQPISFPPTYKFAPAQQEAMTRAQLMGDDASVSHWAWAPHRWPSWCDRVLFSEALQDRRPGAGPAMAVAAYTAHPILPTSDHRPVSLACRLDLAAAKRATQSQGSKPPLSDLSLAPDWSSRRAAARRREIAAGVAAYLGTTWAGNALLLTAAAGVAAVGFALLS